MGRYTFARGGILQSQLYGKLNRWLMRSQLHVEIEQPIERDGLIVLAASAEGHPKRRNRNGKIWIEIPAQWQSWLTVRGQADDLHDAFARIFLVSAMEGNCDLCIHGNVTTSLLANLERWQAIASTWWPAYSRVELRADREVDIAAEMAQYHRGQAETLLAFSGGLDSIDTLYGHRLNRRGRNTRNVTAAMFVHGFDIDWRDERFSGALDRVGQLCRPLGVDLLSARSNLKQLLPNWSISHCAAIMGVMSLFQRRFTAGLLGCSWAYDNFEFVTVGNGSTAITDPLLSSAGFQVIQDFASTRIEKTVALCDRPEVWKLLRVCYQGDDPSKNCGVCEKCVRQMLCMVAAGVEDFGGFESPLTPEKVAAVKPTGTAIENEWRACYSLAQQRGLQHRAEFVAMANVLEQYATSRPGVPEHLVPLAERRRRRPHFLQRMFRRS